MIQAPFCREGAMRLSNGCFWLSAAQFERLEPYLPTDTRGKPRVDARRVISGIIHVLKSGCRWADAPGVYGPHKTLYNRFVRWSRKGVWERFFVALAEVGGPPSAVLIDSSAVKAHRAGVGGKGGLKTRQSGGHAVTGPPRSTRCAARPNGKLVLPRPKSP